MFGKVSMPTIRCPGKNKPRYSAYPIRIDLSIYNLMYSWYIAISVRYRLVGSVCICITRKDVLIEWHTTREYDIDSTVKQKYRLIFEFQKSVNISSGVQSSVSCNIRIHVNPTVGLGQVSRGVSVLCWHAAPVENVLRKLRASR